MKVVIEAELKELIELMSAMCSCQTDVEIKYEINGKDISTVIPGNPS